MHNKIYKNNRNLTRNLSFRVSEEHYQFLRQRAHLKGTNIPEIIRMAIVQGIEDCVNDPVGGQNAS